MNVKSERKCNRCGNVLDTAGTRGLCLSCLSMSTAVRLSSSESEGMVEDLTLEAGLAVGPQDRFLLHDKLGSGGMGEVWLATDQELSREDEPYWVALKFLSPAIRNNKQALSAVRTEVIRSQEMSHANIVRVFDLHTTKRGMPFIKMEYVKGHNLVYWLEESPSGVLHWREVVEIAQQLCGALQYAHETAGVIHRDIKPGNLLLRRDRILKVADFGIAEALYHARVASVREKGLGTIWYASPQQLVGQRPTPADDIHALGATLYELLAGEPPFLGDVDHPQGDSSEALIHQVRFDPAEPLRQRLNRRGIAAELPPKLAALVHRCLEKEAQARPLAREVLSLLPSPTGPAAVPAAAPPSAAKPRPVIAEPPRAAPVSERWEEPAPKSTQAGPALIWLLFLVILGAAGYFGLQYVNAKPPQGTLEIDLSSLTAQGDSKRSILITSEDKKLKITSQLEPSQTRFVTHLNVGNYLITVTDPEGLKLSAQSEILKDKTNQVSITEDLPKVGQLEVDLSNLRKAKASARSISIAATDGAVIKERQIEANDSQDRIVYFALPPAEYQVNVRDADGAVISERVTVQADQTTQVRPKAEPPRSGDLLVELRSFLERKRPRTVVIRSLDGEREPETISVGGADPWITRRLAAGAYEVSMVELFKPGTDQWVVSSRATVLPDRTNRVALGFKRISVILQSNVPDTAVTWPEGLAETNSVTLGASRRDSVLLPTGTFPVRASRPGSGWVQKPSPQLFTVTEQSNVISVNLRFSSAPREGIVFWTNSLDMTFWEIPKATFGSKMQGGWICATETRMTDFAKFVDATRHEMGGGLHVVTAEGVKLKPDFSWRNLPAGFDSSNPQLPVVGVNWDDAKKFCQWLTARERESGELNARQGYRLPTAKEWAELAGGPHFPWGDNAYSLRGKNVVGNYSGKEVANSSGWPSGWLYLKDYADGYARLAPPGREFRNIFGLYHMGGNAAEWSEDKLLCGGSWADGADGEVSNDFEFLRTDNFRGDIPPEERHDRIGFRVYLETDPAKEQAL